jgi:hypothetical protein
MSKATLFQNLLKATSIDTITPAMILQAGAPIFFDLANNPDLKAISTVVNAYRGVHAPLYGQPIPGSGLVSIGIGSLIILQPEANQVRKISSIAVSNAGAAPIIGEMTIGTVPFASFTVDPLSTSIISITNDLFSTTESTLATNVISGNPADATTKIASLLVVQ